MKAMLCTKVLALVLTLVSVSQFNLNAQYVDGTIHDGSASAFYGMDPRLYTLESGETELNTVSSSVWDNRAIGSNATTQTIVFVSGFNPLESRDGFVMDGAFVNTDGTYIVPNRPNNDNGYTNYSNSQVGHDYRYMWSGSGSDMTYSLVKLTASSTVQTSFYAQNSASDPWGLAPGSTYIPVAMGLTTTVQQMTDAQVQAMGFDIGNNGGVNYVWEVSYAAIASEMTGSTLVSMTQSCGNDSIKAVVMCAIPEPGTCAMVGLGLMMTLSQVRKRRFCS